MARTKPNQTNRVCCSNPTIQHSLFLSFCPFHCLFSIVFSVEERLSSCKTFYIKQTFAKQTFAVLAPLVLEQLNSLNKRRVKPTYLLTISEGELESLKNQVGQLCQYHS